MSRIGKQPITVPSGVDVTIAGAHVTVKGPKGQLEHEIVGGVAVEREGDTLVVTPRRRLAVEPVVARAPAQPHQQHGGGCLRRLRQGAGDRRGRLPRRGAGIGRDRARSSASRTRCGSRHRPVSRSRFRSRRASSCAASTSNWSVRSRPTSARSASPSRTRARASVTPASASCARPGSPRSSKGHSHGALQARAPQAPAAARAQEDHGYRRASAPRGVPFEQAHLRAGHRRRRGPHAGERVDDGSRVAGGATATVAGAKQVGQLVGQRAKDADITAVVFDRGGFKFHGRVAAIAEGAREAGLEF